MMAILVGLLPIALAILLPAQLGWWVGGEPVDAELVVARRRLHHGESFFRATGMSAKRAVVVPKAKPTRLASTLPPNLAHEVARLCRELTVRQCVTTMKTIPAATIRCASTFILRRWRMRAVSRASPGQTCTCSCLAALLGACRPRRRQKP